MPAHVICLIAAVCAIAVGSADAAAVTRQGGIISCSLLMNSATATRTQGEFAAESESVRSLAQLMDATARGQSEVTHFPVVAVIGGDGLFPDSAASDHVTLSPALQSGDEICFFAMPSQQLNDVNSQCRAVCTSLQERQATISYHETEMGQLPFLFVGEEAQEYASCREIIYPDYRTALGWMCKGKVDTATVGAGDAATAAISVTSAWLAFTLAVLVGSAVL
eukprot:jgi/Ulvmu1/1413/UM011_0142.1